MRNVVIRLIIFCKQLMYYALVHFPDIDTSDIDKFRRKYDPTIDLIEPHITVLFPVPDTIGEKALVEHINHVLFSWKPFHIHIHGFHKSWDHWLFLTLEEGGTDVSRLNRDIYTEILAPYRRDDIEFIPHKGLGLFVKNGADYSLKDPQQLEFDEAKYEVALKEARALDLDFKCTLEKLHLVSLADDLSWVQREKEFLLGETGV